MSDSVGLLLTIGLEIIVFSLLNYLAFKLSHRNIKKRVWAGVIFLLLSPLIFFGTLSFGLIFDEGGWGAGMMAVIFTGLYLLNGIVVLLSPFGYKFLNKKIQFTVELDRKLD